MKCEITGRCTLPQCTHSESFAGEDPGMELQWAQISHRQARPPQPLKQKNVSVKNGISTGTPHCIMSRKAKGLS